MVIPANKDNSGLKDTLDLASALPANRAYFTYLGSLTTPRKWKLTHHLLETILYLTLEKLTA